MTITVNDIQRTFNAPRISFSQVALMGLYQIPVHDRINPEVTYSYKDGDVKCAGVMAPRNSLEVRPGMSFTVTNGKKVVSAPGPIKAADLKDFIVPEAPRIRVKPEAIERRKAEFAGKGLDWPPRMTEDQMAAETERVRQLMAPHEARYQAAQAMKNNGEMDARLKDAYIIINLLYQESVAAGRMTPARRMAGTLLYSAGYQEIVKKLESSQ